jgi:WW domain
MARKEEVEGAETHEMDIQGGPHTSGVASSLRSLSTGQDISEEAQSVVSQAEGVSSTLPCYLIPRRSFCSFTGSGGSEVPEIIIQSPSISGTTSDRSTQAEAQTYASTQHNSNTNGNQYGPLPGGEVSTDLRGRTYYVDQITRSNTWASPSSNQAVDHQAQEGEANNAGLGSLPAGWEERRTPDGRLFYVDHNTRSNTWVDPRHRTTRACFLTIVELSMTRRI